MSITDKRIIEFLDSFYSPINGELARLRQKCEDDNVPLILRETESYLNTFLKITKPKDILEMGTAYGYSACYFATACEDSHVTTIERAPHMYRNAVSNIEAMKLSDRINVRFGDANDILDSIIGDNSRDSDFDLIFIDAAKSHYREFFDRAEKLARPGASIVCDNMLIHGYLTGSTVDPGHRHRTSVKRMKEFLEYLNGRKDLTISLLSCGDGLSIVKLDD